MANKRRSKLDSEPQPDLVDLAQWLTIEEAVALREEIGRPLSTQRIYALGDEGKIQKRKIKFTVCFARADVLAYNGRRGRPRVTEE